nr:hypothetical protein [uncultured Methanolobus sp.]
MVTFRQAVYASWLILAVIKHFQMIPFLVDILDTSFNLGILNLSIWTAITYIVLVYTSHVISQSMLTLAMMASRSNVTTILAGFIVVLGVCTLIDIVYAYLSGSDLFLVQMIYSTVRDPSGTAVNTLTVLTENTTEAINASI